MKIAYVVSEVFPFVKTGGMADVAGSLPRYLKANGQEIITILPLYQSIDTKQHKIKPSKISLTVELVGQSYEFDVHECTRHGVKHYFLANAFFFEREEIYGNYADNYLRFGAFCHAVILLMQALDFQPDVYHLNDWQSALIAFLVKEVYHLPSKVLLTLHNLAYQGVFDKHAIDHLEIGWEWFTVEAFEFFDHFNLLKGGMTFSDCVNTVSPTYAEEIKQQPNGNGLENFIHLHESKITGILNGLDIEEWNPQKDANLYKHYNSVTFKERKINKKNLLKELGLKEEQKPLFTFIGRFVKQKGLDFFMHTFEFLQELEINLVIVGEGDNEYALFFDKIRTKYDNVYVYMGYSESLSRKLYASSDFLLMPSLFEPCGLNQMIAMRYGAIPVVRKTGGLRDTVQDFRDTEKVEGKHGKGVVFTKKDTVSFLVAIMRAISLYANRQKMNRIARKNMELDFSWEEASRAYIQVYQKLIL